MNGTAIPRRIFFYRVPLARRMKNHIPQGWMIPQYWTLKSKLPKYRLKKSSKPRYRKPPCPQGKSYDWRWSACGSSVASRIKKTSFRTKRSSSITSCYLSCLVIARWRELTVFLWDFVLSMSARAIILWLLMSLNLGNHFFKKWIFFLKQKLGPELLTMSYFRRLNILSF